jgi:hypothetical protein
MRGRAADDLLRLPVRLEGVEVGYPVDVILDIPARRVLGFEVRCRDETHRFLPFSTADVQPDAIHIGSALTLLETAELEYYRNAASTLRSLRGRDVERAGVPSGPLKDVLVGEGGAIEALLVERDGSVVLLRPEEALRIAA